MKRICFLSLFIITSCDSSKLVAPKAISLTPWNLFASEVNAGGRAYFKANVSAGQSYIVGLVGLSDTRITIGLATNESFTKPLLIASNGYSSQSLVEWHFSDAPADLYIYLDGSQLETNQDFQILILPTIDLATFNDEQGVIPIVLEEFRISQVSTGESPYAVENIDPNKDYTVYIFGLVNDADLRLKFDATFTFEQDQTLYEIDSPALDPEEAHITGSNNIYFSVVKGPLATGSAFYILVLEN